MRATLTFIALLCILFNNASAQPGRQHCGPSKTLAYKTTVASPAEDDYDVQYLKFNLNMTNTSVYLSGDVSTRAKVVSATMPAYVFELDSLLTIDSLLFNGINLPFTTSARYIRTVALTAPLSAGAVFTAQVFYHGMPYTIGSPQTSGINTYLSPYGGQATFTLSEAYHAREWWPCKQALKDKIDSVDVWVTIDTNLKAGSNGLLQNITAIDATHNRYEWKERYPIDYYLISLAVGPYNEYSYYMHFAASTDSMLIQNYIFRDPATFSTFQSNMDSIAILINYFSDLYGRYPFDHEKYGHCMANGGMEHQTMTTAYDLSMYLVAHELAHQWFGDNTTCATWKDIYVNEGLAEYSTYMYTEHFWGPAAAKSDMIWYQNDVKSYDTGTVYVTDTVHEAIIFDGRQTYEKGPAVTHSLRFVVNDDNQFFSFLRTYLQQYKNSNATVADLLNVAKTTIAPVVNGISLDIFFSQWHYGQGYPKYWIRWNQVGSDVYIKLSQTTAVPSSVSFFQLPVEIKLKSATGDTTVRILNDANDQEFHFNFSNIMYDVQVDPNAWLICKTQSKIHDLSLGTHNIGAAGVLVKMNPASNAWMIDNITPGSQLTLTDMTGRQLWKNKPGNITQVTIPATQLSPGAYLLQINGTTDAVIKLEKQ